jgi:DNA-binding CsgD family transcriptional regulator
MEEAATLDAVAVALFDTARDLVACDHCGYHEVDRHFGRSAYVWSSPDVARQIAAQAGLWDRHLPSHPVLSSFASCPSLGLARLSDVTDMSDFARSALGRELFAPLSVRHQVVLNLGLDPADRSGAGAFPVLIGLPMNRSGSDFDDRDMAVLAALQRLARPVLRRKRAEHLVGLMDAADLTPEFCRNLMGHGLSERQAEVVFWMLKGKSNGDIGAILGIGAQTVRHHSMAIFARLGVDGRLALQRRVLQAITQSR